MGHWARPTTTFPGRLSPGEPGSINRNNNLATTPPGESAGISGQANGLVLVDGAVLQHRRWRRLHRGQGTNNVFFGNGGNETINAQDGSGGDIVNGGPGSADTCRADSGDTSLSCEL